MSFTEHEVGQVAPQIDRTDVVAPKHLHFAVVAVISFLVPLAGLIMAIGYNKKVTKHNQQVGGPKASARNYWLVFGISAALAFMAVVAVNLSLSPRNATYIVVGTGPAAPSAQPSQAAPSVPVQAPDALPTNPVETGPIQPQAATPEGTIRAIEAYRIRAYETSDPTLLAYYFAVGTNPLNDATNRATAIRVKRVKIEHLVGRLSESVTKVEIVSATQTKIVANVTVRETIDGAISNSPLINTNYRFIGRTYAVIGGRWLETIPFNN